MLRGPKKALRFWNLQSADAMQALQIVVPNATQVRFLVGVGSKVRDEQA
jgi:hypothetical protein